MQFTTPAIFHVAFPAGASLDSTGDSFHCVFISPSPPPPTAHARPRLDASATRCQPAAIEDASRRGGRRRDYLIAGSGVRTGLAATPHTPRMVRTGWDPPYIFFWKPRHLIPDSVTGPGPPQAGTGCVRWITIAWDPQLDAARLGPRREAECGK